MTRDHAAALQKRITASQSASWMLRQARLKLGDEAPVTWIQDELTMLETEQDNLITTMQHSLDQWHAENPI